MQKYKTFIIFIILTAIWSSLLSLIKYFFWSDLNLLLWLDLQIITWYLSIWWIFAYLFWWFISHSFLKRYIIFTLSILSLIFVLFAYLFPIISNFWVSIFIIWFWFFYWLWVVLRTILVPIEIAKTWIEDVKINWIISITFIIFLILWTIAWTKLFEVFWHDWFIVIIFVLIICSIFSLFLNYEEKWFNSFFKIWFKKYRLEKTIQLKKSLKLFFPELKYLYSNFSLIIISSSFIWAISTIVSQKAIEYSIVEFDKLASEASFLLLYSSIWAIIWNIISSFLWKYRWLCFFIFNILLWLLIIIFPFFNEIYNHVIMIAFFIWLVFWWSSNMIDAYYLSEIWKKDKKEYWASIYWFIFSIILFIVAFISSYIDKTYWFDILMYNLWLLIVLITILNFKKILWK